jgi:hypothetical protein
MGARKKPPAAPGCSPGEKWEPTEDQLKMVRAMSGYGVPQVDIALVLGIAKDTLLRRCRLDLDLGMAQANAKVAQSLFAMATVPPDQATSANVAAAIFWTKARMGWREKLSVETLDENGNPITPSGASFVLRVERLKIGG